MGNKLTRTITITCDAASLKDFFKRFPENQEKERLLSYYPVGYNYKYNPETYAAFVTYWFVDLYKKPKNPLDFQMKNLKFNSGCKIKIETEYYNELINFAKEYEVDHTIKFWYDNF